VFTPQSSANFILTLLVVFVESSIGDDEEIKDEKEKKFPRMRKTLTHCSGAVFLIGLLRDGSRSTEASAQGVKERIRKLFVLLSCAYKSFYGRLLNIKPFTILPPLIRATLSLSSSPAALRWKIVFLRCTFLSIIVQCLSGARASRRGEGCDRNLHFMHKNECTSRSSSVLHSFSSLSCME
jgi:hypothetical protein